MIRKIKYLVLISFLMLCSCGDRIENKFYVLNKQFEEKNGFMKEMVLVENPSKNADTLLKKITEYQKKIGKAHLNEILIKKDREYVMIFYYKTENTSRFLNSKKDPYSLNNVYLEDFSETDFLGSVYINKCDKDKSKWISGAYVEMRDTDNKIISKKEKLFFDGCNN